MNILVTGGAGYIGSHVAKALAAEGMTPIVYDNLSSGHRWAVQWGPLEEGDILDQARLTDVIKRYDIKAVIHFAALASVGESVSDPARYYRTNVVGTQTLLDAMRACGVMPIVFSSSCAVYGTPQQVPIVESAPKAPISPYGMTKTIGETMLGDFAQAYGIRYAALRYFNAAGADVSAVIGEDHMPETHLIPLVLDVALGCRESIAVFGQDYPTPDGSCLRDYIHVADLAEAHLLAMKKLLAGGESFAVNLGTGTGVSVLELIEAARTVTGKEIKIVAGARRAGDPPLLFSDVTYCKELLQWSPSQSSLTQILVDAWRWHQKHFASK